MLIDRKVERYVDEVTTKLPAKYRSRATREITDLVFEMIEDYAQGREADILDARAVISELGRPEEMALTWLAAHRETTKEEGVVDKLEAVLPIRKGRISVARMNEILSTILAIFTVIAVCLVSFGIIALGTHAINTMLPIFMGCVLALGSIAGRSVLIREY